MKLGKLLAAGKSIMNGRTEVSYRASKQVYLPKFGPAKNPFKNEATLPSGETSTDTPVEIPTDAPVPAPILSSTVATATPRPTRVAPKTEKIPVLAPPPEKKGHWADKLNPISIFRAAPSKAEAGPAADVAKMPAVMQTELSLDAVRVVHNDLSDVDVEVVPIKSRSSAAEKKTPKKSWEALGERLFGVEAT
jgi:hypothetical protein